MKENRTLEWKEKISSTFLKTVSAYANYRDGKILFGVTDEGKKVGVDDITGACLAIENKINDSISPNPEYTLEVDKRNKVITLTVSEGIDKPYLYKGKAYKRNDTATVEVDRKELQRLILSGEGRYYDGLPSKTEDLTFSILGEALKNQLQVNDISRDILKTLDLYSEQHGYNLAAEILADKNVFPGIDAARFGESIDVIMDRKQFTHQSILAQYENSVELFRTYYQYEEIEGALRSKKERIPEKAFREAAANALVHRQWDIPADIRIAMHPDRIEIFSPGGLPFGVTEEDYLKGYVSVLRNPILASVFFRLHIIEMFGTGIKRIRQAYNSYQVQPSFDITENAVSVVLPVVDKKANTTNDQEKILSLLKNGRILSRAELSDASGFAKDKTIRLVNALVADGRIRKTGRGRGTKYLIG